jgi:purine-binding chemotaxis protein CheW
VAAPSFPVVTFAVDRSMFGLRLEVVERAVAMVAVEPLPGAPVGVLGVVNLHGRVVPFFDLRRRVGWPVREYGADAHLIVARTARRTVAIAADEVIGVREIAADTVLPPDRVVPRPGHLAGVVSLAEGVLFIEDLEAFLAPDEEQRLGAALGASGRE